MHASLKVTHFRLWHRYEVKEITRLKSRKSRTMWLSTAELELFKDTTPAGGGSGGAAATRVLTIPFASIVRVSLVSPQEFKVIYFKKQLSALEDQEAAAQSLSVKGQMIEMEEYEREDDSLTSGDWQPSRSSAGDGEALHGGHGLGRPEELRIGYSGSGPSATKIAGEISDRVAFEQHIAGKRRHMLAHRKGSADPDPARRLRLASHLELMTGMTEVQRITAAVSAIIGGEREEDERLITRPLTRFITRFRAAEPAAVKITDVRDIMTMVCREILQNRRELLEPLLNQLPAGANILRH